MLRVYTAYKLHRGKELIDFFYGSECAFLHARWLKHIEIGTKDSPENAKTFWREDVADVIDSDVVLVYAGPQSTDDLRGALVEAGVAIATGVPVIVVGNSKCYGTWQYHPLVIRVPTFMIAHDELEKMNERVRA